MTFPTSENVGTLFFSELESGAELVMYYAAVPVQYMQCAALIAKVMISEEGRFTESEIQLARELLENNTWNSDVRNFLRVIAKITYVGVDVYDEAYAALTHRRARS